MKNQALKQKNQTPYDSNISIIENIDIEHFTPAPLRATSKVHLNIPKAQAFKHLADHENLNRWVPMIKHRVKVDHSLSQTPFKNGVGSKRVCNFGGDELAEEIVYWNGGYAYGYQVAATKSAPVLDHFSVIGIEEFNDESCVIAWYQFFNPKPWSLKSKMMQMMINTIMDKALNNFKKLYDK